jgi:predicted Zn-dependent protease
MPAVQPALAELLTRSPQHPALYDLVWCRALRYVRRWAALAGSDLTAEPESHRLYSTALRDARWFVMDRGADDRHHLVTVLQAVLTDDLIPELYDALDNMEQLDPTNWHYRMMRAWLLLRYGRPEEAIAQGHRLLERFPRAVEGWAVIARAHEALGHTQEAIAAWTSAIALDARFAEAHFARGRLREGTEPEAADADVQRAVARAPELAAFLGE